MPVINMCAFTWVQSHHVLILQLTMLWENFIYTLYINNGSIVDNSLMWIWDFPGFLIIWDIHLNIYSWDWGCPCCKIDCLNYSRLGSIHCLRPVLYLLNHFLGNGSFILKSKRNEQILYTKKIPGKWLWYTKNGQNNQQRQKRWHLFYSKDIKWFLVMCG